MLKSAKFYNRDKALQQLAFGFVHNLNLCNNKSNALFWTITLAQMMGSGKTVFATRCLEELKLRRDSLLTVEWENMTASVLQIPVEQVRDAVEQFLQLDLVYLSLADLNVRGSRWLAGLSPSESVVAACVGAAILAEERVAYYGVEPDPEYRHYVASARPKWSEYRPQWGYQGLPVKALLQLREEKGTKCIAAKDLMSKFFSPSKKRVGVR